MNIIVFSDSHTEHMNETVSRLKPDMILHLGDHDWDADCFAHMDIPVRYPYGV